MNLIVFGIVLPWLFVGLGCWIGYLLVRQNGRLLLRLEAIEQRLAHLQMGPAPAPPEAPVMPMGLPLGSEAPEFELTDLAGGRKSLADFRSLTDSRIQRSGLAAGTPAPEFTLPRLDGGELSLEEYRGRNAIDFPMMLDLLEGS